jgi:hypothetical protein
LKYKFRASETFWRQFYQLPAAQKDLRALFYLEGDTVFTVDLGTHRIYG